MGSNSIATQGKLLLPNNFYYEYVGNWIPLPSWGQFFLDLGYALATHDNSTNRFTVGLALPVRSYAASLTAAGVVLGKLSLLADSNETVKRFQQISALAEGTPLIYRANGKRVKGLFAGIKEIHGNSMICLRAEDVIHYLPSTLAMQVDLPVKMHGSLPKRSNRRTNNEISPFLSHFLNLDQKLAKTVALQSRLDCVIIGPFTRLKAEIYDTDFAVLDAGQEIVTGTLHNIIRVRKLSKDAEAYRSDIYHMNSKECEGPQQEIPSVTIFDGAKSFLRWKDFWRCSNWVVLLDQTEMDFDPAVQSLNEECIKNEVSDVDLKDSLNFPSKVPVTIYKETL
jgi:hypothetical protein